MDEKEEEVEKKDDGKQAKAGENEDEKKEEGNGR